VGDLHLSLKDIAMSAHPRPLPARPRRHILADLAALACVMATLALGWATYTAIHAFDVVATTAIADGHQAGVALPLVGPTLQADLGPVQTIPPP